jgi:ABC-type branched-subunit amino acid transport system substrate-binding protein
MKVPDWRGAPQQEGQVLLPSPEEARRAQPSPEATTAARPAPVVIAKRTAPGEAEAEPAPEEPEISTLAGPPAITLVPPKGVHETVPVGLLVPLTGPHAGVGAALLDAAQMALFDMADQRFTLFPRDTEGSPDGARRAARELLDEGVRIILGPLLAASVSAVAPEARAANVPVVAFSTDRTVAGEGVFLVGLLPREQVERVVTFALSQGYLRFAALAPDTAFGATVVEALREVAVETGAVVTEVAFYDPTGDNTEVVRRLADYDARRAALEAQVRELQARDDQVSRQALRRLERRDTLGEVSFDAVLVPEGGDRLRALAPLLPYYDIDPAKVRLLGTAQWDDPSLGTEPALVGGWFAAPPPDAHAGFVERFERLYRRPPHRLATLAYDAAALAAVLARAEGGPDFSIEALTAEHGFAGLDGIFRLLPDGSAQRGLAVLEMQRNQFRVVSPAPEVFPKLIF